MAEHGRPASAAAAAAAVVVVVSLLVGTVPAAAEDVSNEQLRVLVERARSDGAALDRLRQVERVGGRAVDLRRALDGASADELGARLDALGTGRGSGSRAVPAAGDPRATARHVLEGEKFDPARVPRPFRGALRRLGGWLRPLTDPLGRAWDRISQNALATGVLAAAVMGTAAVVAASVIRRRTGAGVERGARGWRARPGDDPDELERRAAVAEAEGDLDRALRLRFRAGIVRLDRAGLITDGPAFTTGELSRRLASFPVRDLAAAFEEVAYGGRPATAQDLDAARSGWPRVLLEAAGR